DPARAVEATVAAVKALGRRKTEKAPAKRRGKTPEVSVVVPYYNLGRYLPATLESIRRQTFESYEIVVVDDGSTDPDSVALLETLEAPDLKVVRKRNGGLGSARNAGIAAARGRYVLPLDADDLIAPTFLARTVEALKAQPDLAYATTFAAYFDVDPAQPTGGLVPWGLDRDTLPVNNVASTCTALIPHELLEELGGYDEWLTSFEDWDLYCSMAERGMKAAVLPEFLFFYRWRPDSMSNTVVLDRRTELKTYLMAKHPALAVDPSRAERMLAIQLAWFQEQLSSAQRWNLKRIVESSGPMKKVKESIPDTFIDQVRKTVVKLFPVR
ncbi:MAG: glycosyltransferase family 2 protein, partial [Myxococcales bacterium]